MRNSLAFTAQAVMAFAPMALAVGGWTQAAVAMLAGAYFGTWLVRTFNLRGAS